ncbi:saccharopine dehydrogenase NADP-binding domain-containing protein [Phycicoccus sp. Soil803]|uniref:saccharopine dehydrogenase NADP-binding domain-containing protein n=1 Tax=Phycicoccus sp. Soil803 TaxID=1736415 RepID=UPI000708BD03|nr:saccharopine dehydrogenase NADP-binding domain-containing protein [Phycicoccus sp. Soil803]KRF24409.1 saccharopine dehydrogenase [Phycicoccus sp. Soil803]
MNSRQYQVIVIGAGGAQAQAMLAAAARGTDVSTWLAVDRLWRTETHAATEALGITTREVDPLKDASALKALLSEGAIVANLAGPYYRTGAQVLDAAIETHTAYLDICDDADVTLPMLERAEAARAAGVTAVIGMGSSPGTTNILIRAAVDYLGPVEDVEISWTVDVADITDAAIRHFWHCFNLVEADGTTHPVPAWDELDTKMVVFPGTVGEQTVARLAHPEPLTAPLFLPVQRAINHGAITPLDAMRTAWALAYAVDPKRADISSSTLDAAVAVFSSYRDTRPDNPRVGSGLQIDVHSGGNGLRFSSGAVTPMEEATGVPAAAGLVMLIDGEVTETGVLAPETLSPSAFFTALRRVSRGGGGLELHELVNGQVGKRVRIRDLIAAPASRAG